ncbi:MULTISPECIES: alpha/beta fold hydrolase [unclassified Nocardia]|uniref:esterase/lipase family protein n=1 Tax=unclassified Nocardia TaxID=2637762 RepID=UPI0027DEEDF7|nr:MULTISPECIES: alpha/beta fold hydrolase [unclassified Nocardia]
MRQMGGARNWSVSQFRRAVLACALAGAVIGSGAATGSADPAGYRPPMIPTEAAPPQGDHLAAAVYIKAHPQAVPAGTNDFDCKPTREHPRPVVLAHGTDSTVYSDWSGIAPQLTAAGFCVFALNYGGAEGNPKTYGTEHMSLGAQQLSAFVDQVLAATHAEKVDMVGFSQGANVTRMYINKMGGAPKVDQWIGLASPTYGGVMYDLVPVVQAVPGGLEVFEKLTSTAAVEQAQGSPVMVELNRGGDTVPGVRYVTVGSKVDEMIQPFGNIALRGPGARNIALQDLCPEDQTGHFNMVYDPFVQQLLLQLLDPEHASAPVCKPVALGTGIPQVIIAGHS